MTTRDTDVESAAVTVYWRPGCLFCASLLRGLGRAGIQARRVDIWQDPEGAAFVRSLTGGDETVPTVVVGDVALVNPRVSDVRRQLRPTASAGALGGLRRRWAAVLGQERRP
jgi:mycoredoxin